MDGEPMLSPFQITPAKISKKTLDDLQAEAGAGVLIVIAANRAPSENGAEKYTAEIATKTSYPAPIAAILAIVLKAIVEQGMDDTIKINKTP